MEAILSLFIILIMFGGIALVMWLCPNENKKRKAEEISKQMKKTEKRRP